MKKNFDPKGLPHHRRQHYHHDRVTAKRKTVADHATLARVQRVANVDVVAASDLRAMMPTGPIVKVHPAMDLERLPVDLANRLVLEVLADLMAPADLMVPVNRAAHPIQNGSWSTRWNLTQMKMVCSTKTSC